MRRYIYPYGYRGGGNKITPGVLPIPIGVYAGMAIPTPSDEGGGDDLSGVLPVASTGTGTS